MVHRQERRQKGQAVKWSVHQTRRRAAQVVMRPSSKMDAPPSLKPLLITHTELHKPHLPHSRVASTQALAVQFADT